MSLFVCLFFLQLRGWKRSRTAVLFLLGQKEVQHLDLKGELEYISPMLRKNNLFTIHHVV